MKKLYKVKLEENNPKGVKGYLGMVETIYLYSRGEAIKKAGMFNGKIEEHIPSIIVAPLSIGQIDAKTIGANILAKFVDSPVFIDTDKSTNEKIYKGTIFDDLLFYELTKGITLPETDLEQLKEINQIVGGQYDYIQLINF